MSLVRRVSIVVTESQSRKEKAAQIDALPNGMSLRQKAAAEQKFEQVDHDHNPFWEVAERLRESGMTFSDIYQQFIAIESDLGEASIAEDMMLVPEWKMTVLADADTPSGSRYETYTRIGRDVEELERELELETGFEVASEKTAQIGYAKLS